IHTGNRQPVGSAAQSAALEALRIHGTLSQRQITERMAIPFKNPRSLDLVLRTFEKRGIVRRGNPPAEGDPVLWELLQEGTSGASSGPGSVQLGQPPPT